MKWIGSPLCNGYTLCMLYLSLTKNVFIGMLMLTIVTPILTVSTLTGM